MRIDLPAGSYVVAVSGGVDSVVLLDLLQRSQNKNESGDTGGARSGVKLTVAHLDHGIRSESHEDRKLVQRLAESYGLPFVYHEARLGAKASEATARQVRYDFLRSVRKATRARSIITAHHQDDVLETIILNLLRGTNRKGLHALKSDADLYRPLVRIPKAELLAYARLHGLDWREDRTNTDETYARNYVRHRLLPRFGSADRRRLLELSERTALLDQAISEQLANFLHTQPATERLDRNLFAQLPHVVAREVMAEWLRLRTPTELTVQLLERLVVAAKTGKSGTWVDITGSFRLEIGPDFLALVRLER